MLQRIVHVKDTVDKLRGQSRLHQVDKYSLASIGVLLTVAACHVLVIRGLFDTSSRFHRFIK
jgi:hypothetical protein